MKKTDDDAIDYSMCMMIDHDIDELLDNDWADPSSFKLQESLISAQLQSFSASASTLICIIARSLYSLPSCPELEVRISETHRVLVRIY